jgi:hypothetical protein
MCLPGRRGTPDSRCAEFVWQRTDGEDDQACASNVWDPTICSSRSCVGTNQHPSRRGRRCGRETHHRYPDLGDQSGPAQGCTEFACGSRGAVDSGSSSAQCDAEDRANLGSTRAGSHSAKQAPGGSGAAGKAIAVFLPIAVSEELKFTGLKGIASMRWPIQSLVLSGFLMWACGSPTDSCACEPVPLFAVVHGHVQLASGPPAVGATVSTYVAGPDGCIARNHPDGQTQTQPDGSYELNVVTTLDPALGVSDGAAVCVLVRISPPNGSGISTEVDMTVQLAFRRASPPDSAEVNATLGVP